jgi:transposase-like protein
MRCTHCGSTQYVKNGSNHGYQRYRCNSCKRSFSDRVRKFTYDHKESFLKYYLNNTGVRKCALFIGCAPSLIVRWTRELAENLRRLAREAESKIDSKAMPEIIEMDEIYTRIKKGQIKCQYGLLILENEVKLLHLSSEQIATMQ